VSELIGFFNSCGFVARSWFELTLNFSVKPMEKFAFFEEHPGVKKLFYFSSSLPITFLYGYSERKMVFFELVKGSKQPELVKSDFAGITNSEHSFKVVDFS